MAPRELVESLTLDTVEQMLALSRQAASDPDPATAFSFYLRSALTLQFEDDGLQSILLSHDDESAEIRSAKSEIFTTAATLLKRAKYAGAVRDDLALQQLQHLVCGIEHAARLGEPDDRAPLLEILLAGIRPLR